MRPRHRNIWHLAFSALYDVTGNSGRHRNCAEVFAFGAEADLAHD